MEYLIKPGRIFFAVAMAFFGAHYLTYATGIRWPAPGPPWFPGQPWTAYVAGIGLLAAGASLAIQMKARWAALLLGIALLLKVIIVHLPRLLVNLHDPGPWTSAGEILAICGGALVLAGSLAPESTGYRMRGAALNPVTVIGQYLFALPLCIFGVQHLIYGKFVATLIPAWIPGHLFWAYFIGAAFIASSLSIMTGQMGTLASALLGLMFLLWFLLLHLPRVAASPHNGNEWTSAFIALAMSGGALAIAGSLARLEER